MPADSKRMADRANGILLDTSAVIAHLRGGIDVLALTKPTEPLFLPLIALGELYKGAEKSSRSVHNRQLVDDFLQIAALLYPDSATAESYAKTAVALLFFAANSRLGFCGSAPARIRPNHFCKCLAAAGNYDAWLYDASDSLAAADGEEETPDLSQFDRTGTQLAAGPVKSVMTTSKNGKMQPKPASPLVDGGRL